MSIFSAILLKFDIFGAPVPSFSLGGRTMVNTRAGASVSIGILTLLLIFGLLKLQHLLERKNPIINANTTSVDAGATYEAN